MRRGLIVVAVVIGRGGWSGLGFYPQEVAGVDYGGHGCVGAGRSGKEVAQVVAGAGVGDSESTFGYAVDAFNCAENAAEIVIAVVDETGGSVGRNDDERNAESFLIVGLAVGGGAGQSG